MAGHHLILGRITDFITGQVLEDTHDERLRQGIARFLVTVKGYAREALLPRQLLTVNAAGRRARLVVDLLVETGGLTGMVVQYGPGSLVTRHRPALAISRLVRGYQIPCVVVTNGVEADILDGATGRETGSGLDAVPGPETLHRMVSGAKLRPVSPERALMEQRILYAYEVDGRCPCDDSICTLDVAESLPPASETDPPIPPETNDHDA